MDASVTQPPEGLDGSTPESQGVEPVSAEVRLLPEADPRQPVLGSIDVGLLARKNPDVDFDDWLNSYKSPITQKEMKGALLKAGVNQPDIENFLEELRGPNPQQTVSYAELKGLVDRVNKRQTAYEEASEEAENFKGGMIFDSVKDFLHEQVIGGLQTKPFATLLKVGLSGYLIYKAYKHTIDKNDTARNWFWGLAGGAAGLYILNGAIAHGDKGLTGAEHLGITPKVNSPELKWFCKEAGIDKSRERTALLMKLTTVKMSTLARLYAEGSGEIDIGELLDDPNLTDKEVAELEKMNTARMRESLYGTVGKIMKLAGVSSPLELKQKYPDEDLLGVIMHLSEKYNGRQATEVEDGVDESMSEADRQLSRVLHKMGRLDDIELKASSDRLWMNGYPLIYVLDRGVLKIKSPGDESFTEFKTTPADKLKAGLELYYKNSVEKAVKKAFENSGYSSVDGAHIAWSEAKNGWVVKGLKVPAKPKLGLAAGETLELEADFSADADIILKAGHDGERTVTAADLERSLVNIALAKKIREKGPSSCRNLGIKIDKPNETTGRIEASVSGTKTVFKYKEGRYLLVEAAWEKGHLIDHYRKDMENESEKALKVGLKELRGDNDKFFAGYNLIKGVDVAEHMEFNAIYKSKKHEMAALYEGTIRGLDQDGSDLDVRIASAKHSLLADLKARLSEISQDYVDFKTQAVPQQISEAEFESDYIGRLEMAGITSPYYKEELARLNAVLESKDYAGIDIFSSAYYTVRRVAVDAFYQETGYLANVTVPTAADKRAVDAVIARIEGALTDAMKHGYSPDDTIWADEFMDAFRGTSSTRPSTSPRQPSAPETTPRAPSAVIEVNKEALGTKEKAFDEYRRYASAHFDSMKGLVTGNLRYSDPSLWGQLAELLGAAKKPPVAALTAQWETLLDLKKEDYLKTLNRNNFYKEYPSLASKPDPQDAIAAYIEGKVDATGLPQRLQKIRDRATASSPIYENTYFQMLQELLFIDQEGGVFEGVAADQSLNTQLSSLEAQYVKSKDPAVLEQIIQLTDRIDSPARHGAYSNYLLGMFAQMPKAGITDPTQLREVYRHAFESIPSYKSDAWESSEIGLYAHIASIDKTYYTSEVHPSQISAGYDVEEFMERRYQGIVRDVHSQSMNSPYIGIRRVEDYMSLEKGFLSIKKDFWAEVGNLGLKRKVREGLGAMEQRLHDVLYALKDKNGSEVPDLKKIAIFRSVLFDYVVVELRDGETSFDADDIKDKVVEAAKQSGVELDKSSISA